MASAASILSDFRLYQLISPSLPIGAFTYSQGLEWAIEVGWVTDKQSLEHWLIDILHHSMVTLELPVLRRLYQAIQRNDEQQVKQWTQWLYVSRETKELRHEERQRGRATVRLLDQLDIGFSSAQADWVKETQLAGFALAANCWNIDEETLCAGYLWSWLENATMAGVKLVPLGQTEGQQLLLSVSMYFPAALSASIDVKDHEIGSFTPAQAIASCRHETQYTRLYRS